MQSRLIFQIVIVLNWSLHLFFFIYLFSKELEELRKQGEIVPQLMSECESVSQQLQVQFRN